MELGGGMQAIATEAAAGNLGANILGAVGQAASAFASAQSGKTEAAAANKEQMKQQIALLAADKGGANMPFIVNGIIDAEAFDLWYDKAFPSQ
jgi:hypothetical protein